MSVELSESVVVMVSDSLVDGSVSFVVGSSGTVSLALYSSSVGRVILLSCKN